MEFLDRLPDPVEKVLRKLLRRPEDPTYLPQVEMLAACDLFRRFPRPALFAVAEYVHLREYTRGETIYHERDPGLGLYVVGQGVVILSGEDERREQQEVRRVGRHGAFGLRSLLGEFPRLESATAERDVHLVGLFRPDLRAMIRHHPRLGAAVVLAVGQHLAAREAAAVHAVSESEGYVGGLRFVHHLKADPAESDPFLLID